MSKILLGCVLLATVAMAQPAAAQPQASMVVVDQAQAQPAELSEFLGSLTEGEPLPANHCGPPNWCQLLKDECVEICSPCEVVYAVCYHYVCDGTCGCDCG
jgi:hypothetical protein